MHLNYDIAVDMLQRDSVAVMHCHRYNVSIVNPYKTKLVCFRNPPKVVNFNYPLLFS